MMGPSSHVSKFLLTLFFMLLLYFVFMDVNMYLRIQNYPIGIEKKIKTTNTLHPDEMTGDFKNWSSDSNNTRKEHLTEEYKTLPETVSYQIAGSSTHKINGKAETLYEPDALEYEAVTWVSCRINPLCYPTVKGLMLDHTNHYLFAPLVSMLDIAVGISENMPYITPNLVSYSHVVLAIIAGKLVSLDNLAYRRLGVVLFQIRTFMDDLDGHIARARKHIVGERSEVGTAGFYIDGICDLLGCIFLMLGVFFFLKTNPPRRGYSKVHTVLPLNDTSANNKESASDSNGEVGFVYKPKVSLKKMVRKVLMFSGELALSSMAWNRYIDIYQGALEKEEDASVTDRQLLCFRSGFFFAVAWVWKIVNIHSFLHCILFAIFCDKLWEFLRFIQFSGYALLISAACLTEIHVMKVQDYISGRHSHHAS